jgi:hypothetical protein
LLKILDENAAPTGEYADVTLHKSLTEDGQPAEEKYLLFYYNGMRPTTFRYYLQDGISGVNPTSQEQWLFPHISAFQSAEPDADTNSLCFSIEQTQLGTYPLNTAYKKFWESRILVQYDPAARLIEKARIELTAEQFYTYRMNDEIWLEGQYWRIVEISHDADGRKALATLQSSRTLESINTFTITPGGEVDFAKSPNNLDKSAAGAQKIGGKFYIGRRQVQITPAIARYTEAISQVTQTIINEITNIGGRFRSWGDT